jgi:hypothetical protein
MKSVIRRVRIPMYYLRHLNSKIRPGMVVVHNHILHTRNMPLGYNGFRAWQQQREPDRIMYCPCGWQHIEPHFRVRGTSYRSGARCVSWARLERSVAQAMKAITKEQNK